MSAIEMAIWRRATVLDLANDSIILTDAAGTITYWNRGSERIYGWTKGDALGETSRTPENRFSRIRGAR